MSQEKKLAQKIDAILPQTQCQECAYPSCQAYAEAIAHEQAPIDRCAPGGEATLHSLAALTKQNAEIFITTVQQRKRLPQRAVIRADECIACTKCLPVCPVDAIVGSAKQLHLVIEDECTGCRLCLAACPVDCIDMHRLAEEPSYDRERAKQRYLAHQQRLQSRQAHKRKHYQQHRQLESKKNSDHELQAKRAYIEAAVARAREKRKNAHEK